MGNSNWYIFTILLLYIFTYIAFNLTSRKMAGIMLVTTFSCAYILFCRWFNILPTYWYDTLICYCIGMFFSYFQNEIQLIISKMKNLYLLSLLTMILFVGFLMLFNKGEFLLLLMKNVMFMLTVVMITYKFSFNSKVLRWCGNHLFEIYILQRIPMIICKNMGITDWNKYVGFIICLCLTIIMSHYYKKYIPTLTNKMLKI